MLIILKIEQICTEYRSSLSAKFLKIEKSPTEAAYRARIYSEDPISPLLTKPSGHPMYKDKEYYTNDVSQKMIL